jgi:hypothetical protein
MESDTTMARWYWYYCNGNNFDANNERWWNAIIQNFK